MTTINISYDSLNPETQRIVWELVRQELRDVGDFSVGEEPTEDDVNKWLKEHKLLNKFRIRA